MKWRLTAEEYADEKLEKIIECAHIFVESTNKLKEEFYKILKNMKRRRMQQTEKAAPLH